MQGEQNMKSVGKSWKQAKHWEFKKKSCLTFALFAREHSPASFYHGFQYLKGVVLMAGITNRTKSSMKFEQPDENVEKETNWSQITLPSFAGYGKIPESCPLSSMHLGAVSVVSEPGRPCVAIKIQGIASVFIYSAKGLTADVHDQHGRWKMQDEAALQ